MDRETMEMPGRYDDEATVIAGRAEIPVHARLFRRPGMQNRASWDGELIFPQGADWQAVVFEAVPALRIDGVTETFKVKGGWVPPVGGGPVDMPIEGDDGAPF